MGLPVTSHIFVMLLHASLGRWLDVKLTAVTKVFGGLIKKASLHINICKGDTLKLSSLQSVHLHAKKRMRAKSTDPFYSSHFHTYKSVIPTEGFVSCQWSSLTLAKHRLALAQVHHYSVFTVTVIEQGHINDAVLPNAVFCPDYFALVNAPHLACVYMSMRVSQCVLEALGLWDFLSCPPPLSASFHAPPSPSLLYHLSVRSSQSLSHPAEMWVVWTVTAGWSIELSPELRHTHTHTRAISEEQMRQSPPY